MQDQDVGTLASGFLQSALDVCPSPVEIVDSEGLVIFVNDAWCRMSGIRSREVIGRKRAAVGRDEGKVAETELPGRGWMASGLEMEVPVLEAKPALSRRVLSPVEGGSQCTITVYESSDNREVGVLVHRLSNILTVIMTNMDLLERAAAGTSRRSRLSLIKNAVAAGLDALESIRMRTDAES